MPSLQFRTIREEGVFSSVIESIVFTIKKICSGSCQSRNVSLNLAKNTRLINLNDCNNPANISKSSIGLLPFPFSSTFQDSGFVIKWLFDFVKETCQNYNSK